MKTLLLLAAWPLIASATPAPAPAPIDRCQFLRMLDEVGRRNAQPRPRPRNWMEAVRRRKLENTY